MRNDGRVHSGTDSAAAVLRPLTARSAILSLLLGSHPPSGTGAELVRFGRSVEINESAVRAALTRMVAAGDLVREDGVYALSDRLLARQRRQDEALQVPVGPWDGAWRVAVVTASGKDRASRLRLRRTMVTAHFAELREGVWLRPDNLAWRPHDDVAADLQTMRARPEQDAHELTELLFDPGSWATTGRDLLAHAESARTLQHRLTVFATIVRHLTHDPLLPSELLPAGWPGAALRETYAAFRAEVTREWRRW